MLRSKINLIFNLTLFIIFTSGIIGLTLAFSAEILYHYDVHNVMIIIKTASQSLLFSFAPIEIEKSAIYSGFIFVPFCLIFSILEPKRQSDN